MECKPGESASAIPTSMPPFAPSVHYLQQGDYFVFYWDEAGDYPERVGGRSRLIVLRALFDHSLITGVRINAFSKVMPKSGLYVSSEPAPDFTNDERPELFRPYAYYDVSEDKLIIRWAAGATTPDEQGGRLRYTLLRKCGDERIILGAILHTAKAALHLNTEG